MITRYTDKHHDAVLQLMQQFYNSSAVLHPVPVSFLQNTLHQVSANNPYLDMFVIQCDNSTVGYMQISLTYSTEAGGMVVMLEELYILPQYQGRGLGKLAIQYMFDNYNTASRYRLEVCADNCGAISLYKRMGFELLDYSQFIKDNG